MPRAPVHALSPTARIWGRCRAAASAASIRSQTAPRLDHPARRYSPSPAAAQPFGHEWRHFLPGLHEGVGVGFVRGRKIDRDARTAHCFVGPDRKGWRSQPQGIEREISTHIHGRRVLQPSDRARVKISSPNIVHQQGPRAGSRWADRPSARSLCHTSFRSVGSGHVLSWAHPRISSLASSRPLTSPSSLPSTLNRLFPSDRLPASIATGYHAT